MDFESNASTNGFGFKDHNTGKHLSLLSLLRRSGMAPHKAHNLEKPVQIWPSLFARRGLKFSEPLPFSFVSREGWIVCEEMALHHFRLSSYEKRRSHCRAALFRVYWLCCLGSRQGKATRTCNPPSKLR